MKRDISIDLIKIVGCVMVVLLHMFPLAATRNHPERILILQGIFTLGVPIFFTQAGFMMFRKKDIKKRYLDFLLHLIIPTVIAAVLLTWIEPWVMGKQSLSTTLLHPDKNIGPTLISAVRNILTADFPACFLHLWYMVEYGKVVIIAPLISLICVEEKKAIIIRRLFIALFIAIRLVWDLNAALSLGISYYGWQIQLTTVLLYMLIGYEVYIFSNKIKENPKYRKKFALFFGSCALVLETLRIIIMLSMDNLTSYIWGPFNLLTVVTAVCLNLFILLLPKKEVSSEKVNVLAFIGKASFYVYLFHMPVVRKMITRGLMEWLYSLFM